jgi:hypothetical protein
VKVVKAPINAEVKEQLLSYLAKNKIVEDLEDYEQAYERAGFVKVSVDGAVSMQMQS